ncbi:MAG TPA: ABC transporter permease DevC [Candidatus Binatia bacterium]|nr:ABC transporter permease DevC [Candidatus Binatia bacterium]
MRRGISLAWLQLKHEKLRLFVAIAGVAFAVILIFMQLGFRNALFDSSVRIHSLLEGEVVLISPQFAFLAQPKSFSRRRLYQALGFPGVASVSSVYAGVTLWKNPFSGQTRNIFVLGFDPAERPLDLPEVSAQAEKIRIEDVVLFDASSRPEYGPVADEVLAGRTVAAEVANRRLFVQGLFTLGTSFGVDGTIITSDLNFRRIFPMREEGLIDIGLVRLEPGVDAKLVRDGLTAQFPKDVLVLTKADYIHRELDYWASATPIGFVFAFGVVMGLVVGGIIVYQILFADVSDHLAEYATLKAMGYSNGYLFSVVLQEAVILAVLGFLPGVAICAGLYRLTEDATRLPMNMTPELILSVVVMAIVMCGVSGMIAVRKIRSADPAEIF